MNHPSTPEARKAIEFLTRHPSCRHEFGQFLSWIQHERDARDRENRVRGTENQTTEAHALSKILDVCGASASRSEPETITANAPSANGV